MTGVSSSRLFALQIAAVSEFTEQFHSPTVIIDALSDAQKLSTVSVCHLVKLSCVVSVLASE